MLMAVLNTTAKSECSVQYFINKENSRVLGTSILEGCKPGKSSLSINQDQFIVVLTLIAHPP